MWDWLLARWRPQQTPTEPLAPPSRRLKQYTSNEGIVYEYLLHRSPAPLTWVFLVRTGPQPCQELTVRIPFEPLSRWESRHQTRLRRQEQYAVAKLALFRRLEEGTTSGQTAITDDELAEVLAELDLR